MIILGIVGAPAGGKSTVAQRLQELGATWINADLVARSVLQRDDVQRELIAHFGVEITDSDGQIDRARLAEKVFGDDEDKRAGLTYLQAVIHPPTRLIITEQLRQLERHGEDVAILDVPLLFESGWDRTCDEIWCVDADRDIRLQRATERGWDHGQLQRREASQLAIDQKRRLSTEVIENNGSLAELHETVDRLWGSIQSRVAQSTQSSSRHCLENE